MQRFLRHARIAFHFLAQSLKMRLQYRGDFIAECLAAAMLQAAGLLTLKFLFEHFDSLREWSKPEVFFIYGFSLIPMAFFDAFAMSFYQFSDKYIVGGELDRIMMRPLGSFFQLLMEGISFDFLADLTVGTCVLVYAWQQVGPPLSPLVIIQFIVCVAGAWAVLTGVFLGLTSISFWSQDRLTFLPPVYNLLNFSRYPLNIYKPFIQQLLTWVVPFGFVAFYPSAAFLERGEPFRHLSLAVPLAGAVFLALGLTVWHFGLRKYSGAGS